MNEPIKIDSKVLDHRLYLVNDNKTNVFEVYGSFVVYFLLEMNDNDIIKIIKSAEKDGETPFMISTESKCSKALDFFNTLKIPVRMEKLQTHSDSPNCKANTHKIIMIDTLAVDNLYVAETLRDVLKISWDDAVDIVELVDHSDTDSIPCFFGSKEVCEKFAKLLQDNKIPCEVRENI